VKRLTLCIGQKIDYFLTSHSGRGKVTFFSDILRFYRRKIILKGGTEQIRSRIIRNVEIQLIDRGYDVEIVHGGLNPDILEGIFIPKLNLALVSACPQWEDGIKEGLINLGQFHDYEKLQIYKGKIHDLQEQINMNLELAWEELQKIQMAFTKKCAQGLDLDERHALYIAEKILDSLFSVDEGRVNHRFGQILTSRGIVSYYSKLLTSCSTKYFINGVKYLSGSGILKLVAREAVLKGITVDVYHNFLDPQLVELIVLVDAKLALAIRPLDQGFQPLLKYENTPPCHYEESKLIDEDFQGVLELLAEIERLNDQWCIFYHETLDFKEISKLEEKLVNEILKME
jgi:hypothetical protein